MTEPACKMNLSTYTSFFFATWPWLFVIVSVSGIFFSVRFIPLKGHDIIDNIKAINNLLNVVFLLLDLY